ncbi:MAG: hypothetical protein Q4A21_02450 [bacterium]|nr:hypothetical protein [bacterium]
MNKEKISTTFNIFSITFVSIFIMSLVAQSFSIIGILLRALAIALPSAIFVSIGFHFWGGKKK